MNRITRISSIWGKQADIDARRTYQKYTYGDYTGMFADSDEGKAITKLAEYENTGLSPNEINSMLMSDMKTRIEQVKPGTIFRHFKGGEYLVTAIALHIEDNIPVVIYRPLYDESNYFARPLSNFVERVDKDKYPEAPQEYKFIKVVD